MEPFFASITSEQDRLATYGAAWRRWGPYLSERAWGTVREDYSPDACAWDYFPHDAARSRAFRWNADGLAGLIDENRYFDVFVEYAKATPEDILMRISVVNRGPEAATIYLLPTLWFRNTWSWGADNTRPMLKQNNGGSDFLSSSRNIQAEHPIL